MQRQSAFYVFVDVFSFNDFKFEYSRPPVLPKERRAISAKKELYATAQLDLRRKPFQELSISELFSQLPTALCLGG